MAGRAAHPRHDLARPELELGCRGDGPAGGAIRG